MCMIQEIKDVFFKMYDILSFYEIFKKLRLRNSFLKLPMVVN